MESSELAKYIQEGEGISLEFKRCGNQPGRDVFETICSFGNRQGGNIFLGVTDDGEVEGVAAGSVKSVEGNIANVTSDPNQFSTAPFLEFDKITVGDRAVIRVWVPMSPAVLEFKGVAYDRIGEADVPVRGQAEITALYIRKQNIYTERRVYPWVTTDDLRLDVLQRAREAISSHNPDHPWLSLSDDGLMRDARLFGRDTQTGERGFNLAAIMLLGTDEVISDVVPAYRTDATFSHEGGRRYEDRLLVRTNIVDAYSLLVDFAERWMPDPFVLQGGQRVSSRDVIVRELVANSLIHREYTSPFISTLAITDEGIRTRNASRSVFAGRITLDEFDPTPKNPIIANFFTQMGKAEELGSGTRALYEHSHYYGGKDPVLEEGNVFDAFVASPSPSMSEHDRAVLRLVELRGQVTATETAESLEVSPRTMRRRLQALVAEGMLEVVGNGRSTRYRLPSGGERS